MIVLIWKIAKGARLKFSAIPRKEIWERLLFIRIRKVLTSGSARLLSSMIKARLKPYELLDYLKNHPMVRHLIEGGESAEYVAHLIPEGGYNSVPKVVGDGVVVVGDAAQLVNAIHREGSNMAMASGRMAAEAIIKAKERNDFSEAGLSSYRDALYNSFIIKDLEKYKDAASLFEENPQYFQYYLPMSIRP